jgi:hypothetical protein
MGTPLNVLSVYSSKDAARMAAQVCNSLRVKLGSTFRVTQSEWNAELLRNGKLRQLATSEAVQSDVIILATNEGQEISSEIREWLESFRTEPRSAPSALVALLKCEDDKTPHLVEKSLEAFAQAAKMSFYCHSEVSRSDRIPAPFHMAL